MLAESLVFQRIEKRTDRRTRREPYSILGKEV
jgi:hypothetical protein